MKLAEFQQRPDDDEVYVHPERIASPVGEFVVELQVYDGEPPDERMVELLEVFIARFRADVDHVAGLVFEQYEDAAADEGWAGMCELPIGLSIEELEPELEHRALVVRPDEDAEEGDSPYAARVFVRPSWDEEHCLYLAFEDGRWMQTDC